MNNKNLNHLISIYKKELGKGEIQEAYSELIKYMQNLKTSFSKDMGKEISFGNVFPGYMDYTYFYISNDYLKSKKLKMGLVLNHKEMNFEIWLFGQTKDIQEKYWNLFKGSKWVKGTEIPEYSIFEVVLVSDPEFNDLGKLSEEIKCKFNSVYDEIVSSLKSL